MKTVFSIVFLTSLSTFHLTEMQQDQSKTPIQIRVGDEVFTATLFDNPTSRSLISQMPFSAELKDYAGKEKIFYPEEKLSVESAPKGYTPHIGDITCYGPWGNIAIFYENHGYADGLILLGHIDNVNAMIQAVENTSNKVTFNLNS